MSQTLTRLTTLPASRPGTSLLVRLFDGLLLWQQRTSERHALENLTDQQLRDVGLSRADVERESAKPFWRS